MLSLIRGKRLQSENINLNNIRKQKWKNSLPNNIFETERSFRYCITVFLSVSSKIITTFYSTSKKTRPILSQLNLYSYICAVQCLALFTGNLDVCFYGRMPRLCPAFIRQRNGSVQTSFMTANVARKIFKAFQLSFKSVLFSKVPVINQANCWGVQRNALLEQFWGAWRSAIALALLKNEALELNPPYPEQIAVALPTELQGQMELVVGN